MRTRLQVVGAVGLFLCVPGSVLAQPAAASRLPAMEVGLGLEGAWLRAGLYVDTSMVADPMATVRVTLPFTPNLAFEGVFAAGKEMRSHDFDYVTKALYIMQVRHGIWRSAGGDVQVFATYGGAGVWRRVLEYDELQLPMYAVVGTGLQWEVAARAALRVEVQGLAALGYAPVGVRVSTGVSLPIGRVRDP
jgi:hypothetical protein